MAESITRILGELPSGKVVPLTMDDVTRYIRSVTIESDAERDRRKAMRLRLDLYQDRGIGQVSAMLDKVFKDPVVRALRKEFLDYSQFQNITKRVINEISSVYAEPAKRTVNVGDPQYQDLQRVTYIDRKMRKVNRYVNLLNECLLVYRVRRHDMQPIVDIITPDRFYAIPHPLDPLRLVAVMFDSTPIGDRVMATDPHHVVWTDAETFKLDSNGRLVHGTFMSHDMGRMPAILVHREIPDSTLLDCSTGADLTSAHVAVAMLNILMMKEQKSGTKIPYVTGDISRTATAQPMDSERVTVFQEGMSPGTLDMGQDPRTYIDATRAVIKQIAANYGIPESVFDLSYSALSGFEVELKRIGLREKRLEQILDFRPVEREFAAIMSMVTGAVLPELTFDVAGWSIDFGETEQPRRPLDMLGFWERQREMSLISTFDMMSIMNPELTPEAAREKVLSNIAAETERLRAMRELQAIAGGVRAMVDTNRDAEEELSEASTVDVGVEITDEEAS